MKQNRDHFSSFIKLCSPAPDQYITPHRTSLFPTSSSPRNDLSFYNMVTIKIFLLDHHSEMYQDCDFLHLYNTKNVLVLLKVAQFLSK